VGRLFLSRKRHRGDEDVSEVGPCCGRSLISKVRPKRFQGAAFTQRRTPGGAYSLPLYSHPLKQLTGIAIEGVKIRPVGMSLRSHQPPAVRCYAVPMVL
jgi:hypothetical protein